MVTVDPYEVLALGLVAGAPGAREVVEGMAVAAKIYNDLYSINIVSMNVSKGSKASYFGGPVGERNFAEVTVLVGKTAVG